MNIDSNSPVSLHRLEADFKTNYTDNIFDYERIEKLGFWERFKRWLAEFLMRLFDFDSASKASVFTGYFIKTIFSLLIIALVYFIVRALIRKDGYWVFGRSSDKLDINTNTIDINLLDTDFKKLIKKATEKKNYRLATRYYYLNSLQKLTSKGIIEWDPEKTNYDYYSEIENIALQKQFQYISYLYNYSWYGEFELDAVAYSEVENSFNSLFKTIA